MLPACESQALNQHLDISATLVFEGEQACKYFRNLCRSNRAGNRLHKAPTAVCLERAGDTGLRSPQEASPRRVYGPWAGPKGWGELYTFDKLYSGTFSNLKFKVGTDRGICASLGANKYLVKCSRRMWRYRCACAHTCIGRPTSTAPNGAWTEPSKRRLQHRARYWHQASWGLERWPNREKKMCSQAVL